MRGKYGQILTVLKGTDIRLFLLAVLVYMAGLLVGSVRLQFIAKVQAIALTFYQTVSLTYIGYFFNNFLPTSIGGDVIKGYYLSKKTVDKTGSYTSVFIDRAIGLVTMVFMAFVALFFVNGNIVGQSVKNMVYAITAVSILGIVFLINKNFARKFAGLLTVVKPLENQLKKAYDAIHSYRHHTLLMFYTFMVSIIGQLLYFASIGILALSIGSHIPPIDILIRMPIVSIMSLLPSINGLGVREGSTVFLFAPLIGKENAFAVSVLVIVTLLINSVVGGLIYAISPQFKMKLKDIEGSAA